MTVKEYLWEEEPRQFHIFDSHQEAITDQNMVHADQDYVKYSYNLHKNNKPKVGDAFIYRRPGKSTKNRKFNLYGGGIIDDIRSVDQNGNVEVEIRKPFKLAMPIEQGEDVIENFQWTSKRKIAGSWRHFWNQCGINVINGEDFFGLVGDLECVAPGNYNVFPATISEAASEEEDISLDDMDVTGFAVEVNDDEEPSRAPISNGGYVVTGKHIGEEFEYTKSTVGRAGELLVLELLRERLSSATAVIEHTSVFKGGENGYDIKVAYSDGHEIYIEVKTTKSPFVDGFYITPRELNASRYYGKTEDRYTEYLVYRVYNFDLKEKTANIKVFHAPFSDVEFRFVPTAWKVQLK